MRYTPSAGVGSYGAHPVAFGIHTVFAPWYFDGHTVHWRPSSAEIKSALAIAAAMAAGNGEGPLP